MIQKQLYFKSFSASENALVSLKDQFSKKSELHRVLAKKTQKDMSNLLISSDKEVLDCQLL